MANKIESPSLNSRQVAWCWTAVTSAILPYFFYFPIWLTIICLVLLAARAMLWWQHATIPRSWIINLLALAIAISIFAIYRTLFGREAGVALLVTFACLKLFEARTRRDGCAVGFLCFFVVLCQFFNSQSFFAAALALVTTTIVTAYLAELTHPDTLTKQMKLAGSLLLQATPLMLVLFVLFPRISEPLWGLPQDAFTSTSGLSDSMSPGTISRLSLSSEIAFRAKFEGAPPLPTQLYWRGPVLTRFDGKTWRTGKTHATSELQYAIPKASEDIRYEITLEPHKQSWLFALELPTTLPPDSTMTSDLSLLAKKPIQQRIRYTINSHLTKSYDPLNDTAEHDTALQLPLTFNPRARALGEKWRKETQDDTHIVDTMLTRFRNESFFYTLSPPLTGDNSVDDFLFKTRRGFCEHFAAAFVFVMRAAGIPARVVTGYQGGEVNPVDGYMVIRQSDAHAWAEVRLNGGAWTRIDPTAAISPSRIERGLAASLSANEPVPTLIKMDIAWLRTLRYRWEALSNSWNQWVLGYNLERQRELLTRLGMPQPDWTRMAISLALIGGTILIIMTLWFARQQRTQDPVARAWEHLSSKLSRIGLARQTWEGPTVYADRIIVSAPHLAAEIRKISRLYINLRYASSTDMEQIHELNTRIRKLIVAKLN